MNARPPRKAPKKKPCADACFLNPEKWIETRNTAGQLIIVCKVCGKYIGRPR